MSFFPVSTAVPHPSTAFSLGDVIFQLKFKHGTYKAWHGIHVVWHGMAFTWHGMAWHSHASSVMACVLPSWLMLAPLPSLCHSAVLSQV
eukprot:1160542-Pelagomonas_calceolata.AAC.2